MVWLLINAVFGVNSNIIIKKIKAGMGGVPAQEETSNNILYQTLKIMCL